MVFWTPTARSCSANSSSNRPGAYLPESWAKDPERRQEAGIPVEITFRPKWQPRRWKSSTRFAVGVCQIASCWRMPDTARARSSGRGSNNGACATWLGWVHRWGFGSRRPDRPGSKPSGGDGRPALCTTETSDRGASKQLPSKPAGGRRFAGARAAPGSGRRSPPPFRPLSRRSGRIPAWPYPPLR
jgi:hypothetical protein